MGRVWHFLYTTTINTVAQRVCKTASHQCGEPRQSRMVWLYWNLITLSSVYGLCEFLTA